MRLPIRLLLITACGRASLEGWDSICADGTREEVKRCAADLAKTIRGCGGRRLVPATKCTNLAVAGAASQALNWAVMLAGGLAQHVHTRSLESLLIAKDFSQNSRPSGMSGPRYRNRPRLGLNDVGMPTCFFWTLREPAKRIESGYRHAVQLMASHPLFSVRRPPPLDDLMAAWRSNATLRPKVIQENFFPRAGWLFERWPASLSAKGDPDHSTLHGDAGRRLGRRRGTRSRRSGCEAAPSERARDR